MSEDNSTVVPASAHDTHHVHLASPTQVQSPAAEGAGIDIPDHNIVDHNVVDHNVVDHSADLTLSDKEHIDAHIIILAGVTMLGSIMAILDTTVVGVAQESWEKIFHATPRTVGWTQTGYTLALAGITPLTGWITGKIGSKKTYMLALSTFIVGSLLCAIAHFLPSLIIFRVIQGLGGGMLSPLGLIILTRYAGPKRLQKIMGITGIPMLLAPTFGPVIGGWLMEMNWRYIFLINVPLGLLTLIYAFYVLPNDSNRYSSRLDLVTLGFLSTGLVLFIFGITQSQAHPILSGSFLCPTLIGIILILCAVVNALYCVTTPLIEFRLLENKNMLSAIITQFFYQLTFFGIIFIIPQYCQNILHNTPLHTGILCIPQGLGSMLSTAIISLFSQKIRSGVLIILGIFTTLTGLLVLSCTNRDASIWLLELALLLIGIGAGMVMMPTSASALKTLSIDMIPSGSTLTSIVQQLSASVGTALFTTIITPVAISETVPTQEAFTATYIIATIICSLSIVPALWLWKTSTATRTHGTLTTPPTPITH